MSISFQVTDFCKIKSARLNPSPVCLIAGHNEQGKTSLVDAIAAVLTNVPEQRDVDKKKDLKDLVRHGAKRGEAAVESDTGSAKLSWPSGDYQTIGAAPPWASLTAVGTLSPLDMTLKDRAAFLIELLDASPTLQDIAAGLEGNEHVNDDVLKRMWSRLERDGWDATHALALEQMRGWKGRWEQATGANWGANIMETWAPDLWDDELANADEHALQLALAGAKGRRDEAQAKATGGAARRTQLQTVKDRGLTVDEDLTRARTAESDTRNQLQAAKGTREQCLPLPVTGTWDTNQHPCPHCGKPLIVANGKPTKPEDAKQISREELTRRDAAIKAATLAVREADQALTDAQMEIGRLNEIKRQADEAAAELANFQAGDDVDLAPYEAEIETATKRLTAWYKMKEAQTIASGIRFQKLVADILAPTGLRQMKLADKLAGLNHELAKFAKIINRPPIVVAPDMQVSVGGERYTALARSARWRQRVIFQCVVAMIDGSECIVVDDVDEVEPADRGAVLQAILATTRPAVVCLAVSNPAQVPDLAAAKVGETLWIQDGLVQPLSQSQAA